jgi:hypothetical protein
VTDPPIDPVDLARDNLCPYCRAPHPRRMPPETLRASVLLVAYCARCGGDWEEVYRLDRVELLRPGRTTDT